MRFASIALRNLSRQKKRSALIAGAVALGVFIILTVNAFTAGSVRILKENMADTLQGHIFITMEHKLNDKTVSYIEDDSMLWEATRAAGVADADVGRSVEIDMSTMIYGGKTSMQQIVGLDWSAPDAEFEPMGLSPEEVAKVRKVPNGVVFNRRTAKNLNVEEGGVVIVRMSTINGQSNVGEFVVSHITEDDSDIMSFVSFAHQEYVAELLDLPTTKTYSSFQVRAESLDAAPALAEVIKATLAETYELKPKGSGSFDFSASRVRKKNAEEASWEGIRVNVRTINEMLAPFTTLVDGMFIVSLVIFVILMVITIIGIANTFRMILFERIREIGTMRALGSQKEHVRSMMLYEALFLSLVGYLAGLALSLVTQALLTLPDFGTTSAFSLFTHQGHLTFRMEPVYLIVVLAIVSIFTILAALGPARKAARLEPAAALRTSN